MYRSPNIAWTWEKSGPPLTVQLQRKYGPRCRGDIVVNRRGRSLPADLTQHAQAQAQILDPCPLTYTISLPASSSDRPTVSLIVANSPRHGTRAGLRGLCKRSTRPNAIKINLSGYGIRSGACSRVRSSLSALKRRAE